MQSGFRLVILKGVLDLNIIIFFLGGSLRRDNSIIHVGTPERPAGQSWSVEGQILSTLSSPVRRRAQ